jgi:DNA-binding NtrC family response regulator
MALLNVIRANFPDVAVVVITRPGKLRNGILAMIEGASGYIQTPLQPEMVATCLRSALRRKQLDSTVRG